MDLTVTIILHIYLPFHIGSYTAHRDYLYIFKQVRHSCHLTLDAN